MIPDERLIATHTNSQGEQISLVRVPDSFKGQGILLTVHDDPPPLGSGTEAPMLLDLDTWRWLQKQMSANWPWALSE